MFFTTQHNIRNSFLNFCENRILFINEGGDDFYKKIESKKSNISIFLKNIENELFKFLDENKDIGTEGLWKASLYYLNSKIEELKSQIANNPQSSLFNYKLKSLENYTKNISTYDVLLFKLGYRKDKRLYDAVKRFHELGLTSSPLDVSSIRELRSLDIQRSVESEKGHITDYISKTSDNWRELIHDKKETIGKMHPDCRMSLCIPAYHEELIIKHTLDVIYSQEFENINNFEVIICENSEGELDKTGEIVRKYARENNLTNLHCITKQFQKGEGGVGIARKLATDVALFRSVERDQSKPFYIASEDADLMRYSHSRVLSNMIQRMDKNQYLDGTNLIHGKMPEVIQNNDILFLIQRADNLFLLLSEREKNSPSQNKDFGFKFSRTVTLGSGAIFQQMY